MSDYNAADVAFEHDLAVGEGITDEPLDFSPSRRAGHPTETAGQTVMTQADRPDGPGVRHTPSTGDEPATTRDGENTTRSWSSS